MEHYHGTPIDRKTDLTSGHSYHLPDTQVFSTIDQKTPIIEVPTPSRGYQQYSACHLPDELWTEIWDCIPIHETSMQIPFPFVASWVSQAWRRISFDTPSLWREVRLSPLYPVELMRAQLERSMTCSLDICIDLLGFSFGREKIYFPSEDGLAHVTSLLLESTDRCRSFELHAGCNDAYGRYCYQWFLKEIMKPFISARAPRLERLYIQCPEEDHPGPIFTGGTPKLSHLTLLATQCTTHLSLLHGLTSLELSCIPYGNALSPLEFQNTLAACPNLAHLAIRNECITYPRSGSTPQDTVFHLPSLLSLSVELHHADRYFARRFFDGFTAPCLESLELRHFQWESYRAFVVAMCQDPTPRFPNLFKLILYDVDILHTVLDNSSRNYCLKLLLCFPSIKDLVIDTEDPEDSEFLKLLVIHHERAAEPLCPRLRSLAWLGQFLFNDEAHLVRRLIASRVALDYPITSLCCFRDTFEDLDADTQDWLLHNTRVELRQSAIFSKDV